MLWGLPASRAILLLVVLRVVYYLYYSVAGVLWLLPWAVVSAAVYWRWRDPRLLLLLIAGHALFNLRYLLFGDVGIYVYFLLALVALGIAFALDRHWYRRPPTRTRSVGPRPPRVAVSSPQPEADGGLG